MKELNAYEEMDRRPIWKRGPDYKYVYCNKVVNPDYNKIYCIIGFDQLKKRKKEINTLYEDPTNDFLVLDNKCDVKQLCTTLDRYGWERMKCYSMTDCSKEELRRYFHLIYNSLDNYEILDSSNEAVIPASTLESLRQALAKTQAEEKAKAEAEEKAKAEAEAEAEAEAKAKAEARAKAEAKAKAKAEMKGKVEVK
jgi:DNA-binding PadR family transcriptional regulator